MSDLMGRAAKPLLGAPSVVRARPGSPPTPHARLAPVILIPRREAKPSLEGRTTPRNPPFTLPLCLPLTVSLGPILGWMR